MTHNDRFFKASRLYEEGYREEQEYWHSIRERVTHTMPGMVERIERCQIAEHDLHLKANAAMKQGRLWVVKIYLIRQAIALSVLGVEMQKVRAALDIHD